MNNIDINIDNTKILGEEVLSLANDYNEIIEKIRIEVDDIIDSNIWIGRDSNIFIEGSNKYITLFKDVKNILNFYGEFINNSALVYKELEEDYSNRGIYE